MLSLYQILRFFSNVVWFYGSLIQGFLLFSVKICHHTQEYHFYLNNYELVLFCVRQTVFTLLFVLVLHPSDYWSDISGFNRFTDERYIFNHMTKYIPQWRTSAHPKYITLLKSTHSFTYDKNLSLFELPVRVVQRSIQQIVWITQLWKWLVRVVLNGLIRLNVFVLTMIRLRFPRLPFLCKYTRIIYDVIQIIHNLPVRLFGACKEIINDLCENLWEKCIWES